MQHCRRSGCAVLPTMIVHSRPTIDTSVALAPAHAEVQQAVEQADHANADETSWREGTCKPWLWVAVTAVATLFMLQYGRGKRELRALLGATFAGG